MSNSKNHQSDKQSVAAHVEHLCGLGCTRVNEIIDALERGEHDEELSGIPHQHREQVLAELKAIMVVYKVTDEEEPD